MPDEPLPEPEILMEFHPIDCACSGRGWLPAMDGGHPFACRDPRAVKIPESRWIVMGRPRTFEEYRARGGT